MTNPTANLDPLKLEATPEALAADAELVQLYRQLVEQRETAAAFKRQWDEYRAKFDANAVPMEPPVPEGLQSVYDPDKPGGMSVEEFEASYLVHKRHKGEEWADNWRHEVNEAMASHSAAVKASREAWDEAYERCFPEGFEDKADAAWDALEETEERIKATHAQSALGLLIKLQVWKACLSADEVAVFDQEPIQAVMADAARIASPASTVTPAAGLVAAE